MQRFAGFLSVALNLLCSKRETLQEIISVVDMGNGTKSNQKSKRVRNLSKMLYACAGKYAQESLIVDG